jgi:alkaline phosphatase D
VLFCDQRAKGYMLSTRTSERATADCQAFSTITAKPYQVNSISRFVEDASTRSLRRERREYGGGGDVQPVGLSWR